MAAPGPADAELVTSSAQVMEGPVLYRGGVLVGTDGAIATVTIRDGADTSADVRDTYRAVGADVDRRWIGDGLIFYRGLHVQLGAGVASFVVYATSLDPTAFAPSKVI